MSSSRRSFPRALASTAFALLSILLGGHLTLRAVRAEPALAPAGTLASVRGASAALQQLGVDDEQALRAILGTTFDGARPLPFDVSRFRSDARARGRTDGTAVRRVPGDARPV